MLLPQRNCDALTLGKSSSYSGLSNDLSWRAGNKSTAPLAQDSQNGQGLEPRGFAVSNTNAFDDHCFSIAFCSSPVFYTLPCIIIFAVAKDFSAEQQDVKMGRVEWDRGRRMGFSHCLNIKEAKTVFSQYALKREQNIPVKSGNWVTLLS